MFEGTCIDLAKHRLSRAKEIIEEGDCAFNGGMYKSANNRAYYAIFTSMRAVLALDIIDFKKHSAVISYFIKEYIKTEKIDKKFSNIIKNAEEVRNNSDYDDFFIATKEEAQKQIEDAKLFYDAVENYIEEYIKSGE